MKCIKCGKESGGSLGGHNICPYCDCGIVKPFFGNEPSKCQRCGENMPWAGPDIPWMGDGIWCCKKCGWSPANSLPVTYNEKYFMNEQAQDKKERNDYCYRCKRTGYELFKILWHNGYGEDGDNTYVRHVCRDCREQLNNIVVESLKSPIQTKD